MHWHGVAMKADDWVLLSFPAANRGPAQFECAENVLHRPCPTTCFSG